MTTRTRTYVNTQKPAKPARTESKALWLLILGLFMIVFAVIITASGGEGSGLFLFIGFVSLIAAAIARPVELHLRRLKSIEDKL